VTMCPPIARRRRSERGAAAVEFAIVMPLVLLLVCGIVDFGRMLNVQITLSAAAREGARWEALRLPTTTGVSTASRVVTAAPGVAPAPTTAIVSSCPASPSPTQNAAERHQRSLRWRRSRHRHLDRAGSHAMRRVTRVCNGDDRGAVALLVAVLLSTGVLLGMAALSVDVGQLYAERRQVQNGADAAALAVAASCATSTTCTSATAGIAGLNANDGATAVVSVCGAGRPALAACPAGSGPVLTQCAAPPAGAEGWVRVRTATGSSGGGTLLPPTFAQALAGNAGYAGTQVQACAQAAWGGEASGTSLPLTLSACEWNAATANGTAFAPPPPYPPYPAGEVALKLHSTSERGGCPSSGGAYGDLPGGFGWLQGGGCTTTVSAGGTVFADTGVSASSCADQLAALVGTLLYLPVSTTSRASPPSIWTATCCQALIRPPSTRAAGSPGAGAATSASTAGSPRVSCPRAARSAARAWAPRSWH
jgi:Flp pilus assembly protein TadG